jgi:hypothetical protein
MGGHGHSHGNENNIKETNEEMLYKIQKIETIKHCPNHWHMDFFSATNMYAIVGGHASAAYAGIGAAISYSYYLNRAANMPYNFYAHNMRSAGRLMFGGVIGLFAGYLQFGDRQRLHNAWVAERLRRRYPESMTLEQTDLWKFKGVKASHEYYAWN